MAAQTMRTRARTMTGFQEENELIRIAVHPALTRCSVGVFRAETIGQSIFESGVILQ
jgi:hypothetical protein